MDRRFFLRKTLFKSVLDVLDDIFDRGLETGIGFHLFLDLLGGINDGGVIAVAELFTHGQRGHLHHFAHHIDGGLTGDGDIGRTLTGTDIIGGDFKGFGNFFDNAVHCDGAGLIIGKNIADGALRKPGGAVRASAHALQPGGLRAERGKGRRRECSRRRPKTARRRSWPYSVNNARG